MCSAHRLRRTLGKRFRSPLRANRCSSTPILPICAHGREDHPLSSDSPFSRRRPAEPLLPLVIRIHAPCDAKTRLLQGVCARLQPALTGKRCRLGLSQGRNRGWTDSQIRSYSLNFNFIWACYLEVRLSARGMNLVALSFTSY